MLQTAKITAYLPATTEHFASDRLHALAKSEGAPASEMPEVLFVCVQNAGRSQMAAALLNAEAEGRIRVRSAGSMPAAQLDATVVAAMAEMGLTLPRNIRSLSPTTWCAPRTNRGRSQLAAGLMKRLPGARSRCTPPGPDP